MPPKFVKINEVGPREGVQIEAATVSTADKIALIDMLSDCNFPMIEVASLVNPRRVPQMADAEQVIQGIRHREGTSYMVLTLNAAGIRRALELGAEPEPLFLINTSDTFSRKNQNRSAQQILERMPEEIAVWREFGRQLDTLSVSTVWGCNYEGDMPVATVLDYIERALAVAAQHDHRFRTLQLGDTTGWATPSGVKSVVGAVRDRWPDLHLRLHLHDTHGLGLANAYAALEMGVDEFDASVGGLGGCPFAGSRARQVAGNIVTEDFVNLCHESGIETGVDLERLLEVAQAAEKIFGHPLAGRNMYSGSVNSYRHASANRTETAINRGQA